MFSFAITAYNETTRPDGRQRILECIAPAQEHPGIGEIVIVDDGSEDADALAAWLEGRAKVKFYRNATNLGVFGNKLAAVARCSGDWVINCDSDNLMDSRYLDHVVNMKKREDTWYSPSFAQPDFDYRELAGEYDLDGMNALVGHPMLRCCLNTGNQTVHRRSFLDVFGLYRENPGHLAMPNRLSLPEAARHTLGWRLTFDACDSFIYNLYWLTHGGRWHIVDGLHYSHYRCAGPESNYVRAPEEKTALESQLFAELKSMCRIARRPAKPKPVLPITPRAITMSKLGQYGRFGNQLFQYMFLRTYGKKHDLTVQTAPWLGETLYRIAPEPVTHHLPAYQERSTDGTIYTPKAPEGEDVVGRDFLGYAQYHTAYYWPDREFIWKLFQPRPSTTERLAPAVAELRALGRTRIGLHLRRGDYGRLVHYITPVSWYLKWLEENWARFDRPVLFIATEDRSLVDEFKDYSPVTTDDLDVDLSANPIPHVTYLDADLQKPEPHLMDFFPDFWLLQHCEVLVTPNSTFSFVAGMLSRRLKEFWRSDLPTQTFVELDPWDAHPLTHDKAEDFRDVPGVCLEHNPPHW